MTLEPRNAVSRCRRSVHYGFLLADQFKMKNVNQSVLRILSLSSLLHLHGVHKFNTLGNCNQLTNGWTLQLTCSQVKAKMSSSYISESSMPFSHIHGSNLFWRCQWGSLACKRQPLIPDWLQVPTKMALLSSEPLSPSNYSRVCPSSALLFAPQLAAVWIACWGAISVICMSYIHNREQ